MLKHGMAAGRKRVCVTFRLYISQYTSTYVVKLSPSQILFTDPYIRPSTLTKERLCVRHKIIRVSKAVNRH